MLSIATVLLTLSAFSLPGSCSAQLPGTRRIELQRHDLSIPGHEAV